MPEFVSARRYEEHNVEGTLRWFNRRFLTIYEFASESVIDQGLKGLGRPGRTREVEEWERWKTNHLSDVTSVVCRRGRRAGATPVSTGLRHAISPHL